MKPKIYVETSVVSYLTARPSRDLIIAANQQITEEWWQTRQAGFDLYISQMVVQEAGAGDPTAAQQRLQVLEEIPLLELNEEDSGALWTFETDTKGAGGLSEFEIRPGESTAFTIGPPFQIRASMRRYSQDVSITFSLEGQAGERYRSLVKRNGVEAPEPSFKIVDRSGRVAHSGRFEYG